jgi:hypothetical protein
MWRSLLHHLPGKHFIINFPVHKSQENTQTKVVDATMEEVKNRTRFGGTNKVI